MVKLLQLDSFFSFENVMEMFNLEYLSDLATSDLLLNETVSALKIPFWIVLCLPGSAWYKLKLFLQKINYPLCNCCIHCSLNSYSIWFSRDILTEHLNHYKYWFPNVFQIYKVRDCVCFPYAFFLLFLKTLSGSETSYTFDF